LNKYEQYELEKKNIVALDSDDYEAQIKEIIERVKL